jgi:hypothetical protein
MWSGFGNNWHDSREAWARQKATQLFDRALVRGRLRRLWSKLTGQPHLLLNPAKVQPRGVVGNTYYAGLQTVSVDHIRGSYERRQDFDDAFFPSRTHVRERWVRVAMARYVGTSLPPVHLVKLGPYFFVQDGHHRVSVARALGQQAIEAEVTVIMDNRERLPRDMVQRIGLFEKGLSIISPNLSYGSVGLGRPSMEAA